MLIGRLPSSHVEDMIDDPFGPLWRDADLQREIQARLERSFPASEGTVADTKEVIDNTEERLARYLRVDGKARAVLRA